VGIAKENEFLCVAYFQLLTYDLSEMHLLGVFNPVVDSLKC